MRSNSRMILSKVAALGLFAAVALVLYIVESLIPSFIPIPGIKLGLANIVTLFLLIRFKPWEAGIVLLVRLVLAAAIAGQMISFLYSLAGGLLCLLSMYLLLIFTKKKWIPLVSITGALFHNFGQLCVARLLLSSKYVWTYLPYLMLSGAVTGLLTGLICPFLHKKMPSPETIRGEGMQDPESDDEDAEKNKSGENHSS